MITFDDVVAITRQSALTVFERRAEREGLTITVCGSCSAYLSERPGESRIEKGACLEHQELATGAIQ
jgi:hypothetical protein